MKNRYLIFVLAILILLVNTSYAKVLSFEKTGVSFGLHTGAMKTADTSFVPNPQTTTSTYSSNYGMDFDWNLGKFLVMPGFDFFLPPKISGTEKDSQNDQYFQQISNASIFAYQLQVLLIPWVAEGSRMRFLFGGGYGNAKLSIKNTRNYLSGLGGDTVQTYSERGTGSRTFWQINTVFEFFLAQNYSMAFEGGYRDMKFDAIHYAGNTDTRGNAVNKGDPMKTDADANQYFNLSGYYLALHLRLNF